MTCYEQAVEEGRYDQECNFEEELLDEQLFVFRSEGVASRVDKKSKFDMWFIYDNTPYPEGGRTHYEPVSIGVVENRGFHFEETFWVAGMCVMVVALFILGLICLLLPIYCRLWWKTRAKVKLAKAQIVKVWEEDLRPRTYSDVANYSDMAPSTRGINYSEVND